MKKFIMTLCAVMLVLGMVGFASAIPIEIGSGSTLNLIPTLGFIDYSYTAFTHSLGNLATGSSVSLNFFSVDVNFSISMGTADVFIDFVMPMSTLGAGSGSYWAVGAANFVAGSLTWDNDIYIPYDSGGDTGLLTLALNNLFGVSTGSPIIISGTLTNSIDPAHGTAPVPEPATILLMGTGLLGLVAYSRKRFRQKS